MLRTLCTLTPSTKADGGKCLKGTLSRSMSTTASDGSPRTYPAGTKLVLVKNERSGSYSLLAQLDDPADDLAREYAAMTEGEKHHASPF